MVDTAKNRLATLLAQPHDDVKYLCQEDISLVLSKALVETFKAKPLEPKKYFAKYLLNISAQRRQEKEVSHFDGYKPTLLCVAGNPAETCRQKKVAVCDEVQNAGAQGERGAQAPEGH